MGRLGRAGRRSVHEDVVKALNQLGQQLRARPEGREGVADVVGLGGGDRHREHQHEEHDARHHAGDGEHVQHRHVKLEHGRAQPAELCGDPLALEDGVDLAALEGGADGERMERHQHADHRERAAHREHQLLDHRRDRLAKRVERLDGVRVLHLELGGVGRQVEVAQEAPRLDRPLLQLEVDARPPRVDEPAADDDEHRARHDAPRERRLKVGRLSLLLHLCAALVHPRFDLLLRLVAAVLVRQQRAAAAEEASDGLLRVLDCVRAGRKLLPRALEKGVGGRRESNRAGHLAFTG
mmetsp:Transcript_29184/g.79874  ORF Transcript_29184/g.79874 Transcript_29184/m.79874 type:complete len:295 (+) Transcript_29184:2337-3221(+)